jgi:hypothetical protein
MERQPELTPEQREHWEQRLKDAEKAYQLALRTLGYEAIKDSENNDEERDDE